MSLHDLIVSDPDFDSRSTEDLKTGAIELRDPAERARCLFALSKRVTRSSLEEYFALLDHERSQAPTVFGSFPVYAAGTIALLVNSSGEVAQSARHRWFQLPFLERHDLRTMHEGGDITLPMTDSEQARLDAATETVVALLGPGAWRASPTRDELAIFVDEPPPSNRGVIVADDESALLVITESRWEAEQAFALGARSSATEFAQSGWNAAAKSSGVITDVSESVNGPSQIDNAIAFAQSVLGVSASTVPWVGELLNDGTGVRVWEQSRGGRTVIVGDDRSVLVLGSVVGPDDAIAAWSAGERTSIDVLAGPAASSLVPIHDEGDKRDKLEQLASLYGDSFNRSLWQVAEVHDLEAWYGAEVARGGRALLVGSDGSFLNCSSLHPINDHLRAWRAGERSTAADINLWNNCGGSAISVHRRLTGLDADAVAAPGLVSTSAMEAIVGSTLEATSFAGLAAALAMASPGSTAVVGIDRVEPQPGHWFNAYVDGDGVVHFVDGQHNQVMPWADVNLGSIVRMEAIISRRS